MTVTSYLLANGWKPSPTTWCAEGGFEHPRLGLVPRALTEGEETYAVGEIRMRKDVAFMVQAVHERSVQDALQERASWVGNVCMAVAEHCAAICRLAEKKRP